MKKSFLILSGVLSFNALVAQNNPPATNPPRGSDKERIEQRTDQKTTTTTTTRTQSIDVPADVNKRFSADYPNVRSTWSMTGSHYRAEYNDGVSRLGRAVIYDETGQPVGTERELGMGEYPSTINEYYRANFPNETYKVWTSEDNTGKRNYYVTRKTDVIWFDDKGNFKSKTSQTETVK